MVLCRKAQPTPRDLASWSNGNRKTTLYDKGISWNGSKRRSLQNRQEQMNFPWRQGGLHMQRNLWNAVQNLFTNKWNGIGYKTECPLKVFSCPEEGKDYSQKHLYPSGFNSNVVKAHDHEKQDEGSEPAIANLGSSAKRFRMCIPRSWPSRWEHTLECPQPYPAQQARKKLQWRKGKGNA